MVDDDAGLRQLVSAALEEAGLLPVPAHDAREALAVTATEDVDVAIVDINLPLVSGYELCRRLKESRPTLPVIFLSGTRTEWFDRVGGLLLGADDYSSSRSSPTSSSRACDPCCGGLRRR